MDSATGQGLTIAICCKLILIGIEGICISGFNRSQIKGRPKIADEGTKCLESKSNKAVIYRKKHRILYFDLLLIPHQKLRASSQGIFT